MRAGSLCTGIGGLDLAVERHFGAELAWYCEVESAPCQVLEREWPRVPNLDDLTILDWSTVPRVDVLSAGYPCQPFSHAGKRKGSTDARHLWPYIADAVRVLRPRWVVLENVAGHLSLGFDRVLGDLAEAGFDAEWCVLRASDVGAPHQRARLFIVATNADRRRRQGRGPSGPDAEGQGSWGAGRLGWPARAGAATADADQAGPQGTQPAQRRRQSTGGDGPPADARGERHGGGQDGGAVGRVDRGDAGEARQRQRSRSVAGGRGHAAVADAEGERRAGGVEPRPDVERDGLQPSLMGEGADSRHPDASIPWGRYAAAIHRWELTLGRPAPHPTDDAGRLSPPFVEWMMGYPEGWADGLTRTQALKALGNAVVPQQGLAALSVLAPLEQEAVA